MRNKIDMSSNASPGQDDVSEKQRDNQRLDNSGNIHEGKNHYLPMKTGSPRGKNIAPHQDKRDCHANEIGKYHRNR